MRQRRRGRRRRGGGGGEGGGGRNRKKKTKKGQTMHRFGNIINAIDYPGMTGRHSTAT